MRKKEISGILRNEEQSRSAYGAWWSTESVDEEGTRLPLCSTWNLRY